jgi:hypothetical protein
MRVSARMVSRLMSARSSLGCGVRIRRRGWSGRGFFRPGNRRAVGEYERDHAQLATDRVSTAGITTARNGPVSSEIGLIVPTDRAQAATNGDRGTNGTPWPLRQVVQEQAR